ncbi:hypothetical protein NDU88_012110 [Pleurodeles waltl]|uniref:Secreted protein n=1 Tax=Pleurodeles waltl TaxID=8319 RepID=A0AAV7R3B2_PLEWA|nr:hypothetical protein NDU88_012110 [Pleurodeles waltl]
MLPAYSLVAWLRVRLPSNKARVVFTLFSRLTVNFDVPPACSLVAWPRVRLPSNEARVLFTLFSRLTVNFRCAPAFTLRMSLCVADFSSCAHSCASSLFFLQRVLIHAQLCAHPAFFYFVEYCILEVPCTAMVI